MLRKERIEQQISQNIQPTLLIVADESANHHVPEGAQTHFKVIVVSEQFHEKTRIARHRLINSLLSDEFNLGLHALSLHLYTPKEWEKSEQNLLKSPNCKDGFEK